MTATHTHTSVWDDRIIALTIYSDREGTSLVPSKHIELVNGEQISLGAWVSYARTRHRNGSLSETRISQLEGYPEWKWGPLRPGPKPDNKRDSEIKKLRNDGASLQSIGTQYGLSRQRIHQIVAR